MQLAPRGTVDVPRGKELALSHQRFTQTQLGYKLTVLSDSSGCATRQGTSTRECSTASARTRFTRCISAGLTLALSLRKRAKLKA